MFPILASFIVTLTPPLAWQAQGRAEAEQDIAASAMKWRIYGYMAGLTPADRVAKSKLRERFDVELKAVAQCVVTHELVERAEGYNARIREEIESKHGVNAMERALKEAWEESQPRAVAVRWLTRLTLVLGGVWFCRRVLARRRKSVVQTSGV